VITIDLMKLSTRSPWTLDDSLNATMEGIHQSNGDAETPPHFCKKPMFSSLKITEDAHNSHAETHLFASTKALSQRFQTAAGEASKGPHLYSPSGCNGVGCFAFRDSQQEHILQ
jgi:hypothetical protein